MAEREVKGWFTLNGKHIPIFEGESKQDAVNRSIAKDNEDLKNKQIGVCLADWWGCFVIGDDACGEIICV